MCTYVFAYYLKKNNQSLIFEANQKDLESATEKLSEYLERDITSENLADIKQKVQDKYRCDMRHLFYDHFWIILNVFFLCFLSRPDQVLWKTSQSPAGPCTWRLWKRMVALHRVNLDVLNENEINCNRILVDRERENCGKLRTVRQMKWENKFNLLFNLIECISFGNAIVNRWYDQHVLPIDWLILFLCCQNLNFLEIIQKRSNQIKLDGEFHTAWEYIPICTFIFLNKCSS